MTRREISIAIRLWLWAAALRPLKRIVPLEGLVRLMHRPARGSPVPGRQASLEAYLDRIGRFPFRPPSNCLERSLGAYRLLCAASRDPQLVIGVRRVPGRGVEGHVWVTVNGRALAERAEDLASYTAIVWFDSQAQRHAADGTGSLLAGIPLR